MKASEGIEPRRCSFRRHLWVLQNEHHYECLYCHKARPRRKRLLCYVGLHNWIPMQKPMHMADKSDERYLACRHCGKYGGEPGQPWTVG